jgi:hypothetical protein
MFDVRPKSFVLRYTIVCIQLHLILRHFLLSKREPFVSSKEIENRTDILGTLIEVMILPSSNL